MLGVEFYSQANGEVLASVQQPVSHLPFSFMRTPRKSLLNVCINGIYLVPSVFPLNHMLRRPFPLDSSKHSHLPQSTSSGYLSP
jgi:hypothetical protein